jgi:hypothetical protein
MAAWREKQPSKPLPGIRHGDMLQLVPIHIKCSSQATATHAVWQAALHT